MKFEFSAGAFVYRIKNNSSRLLFLISPKGDLDIPKGHIERKENAFEAAHREIKEETGLEVRFVPYFKKIKRG
jgi:8-oxo-dGTP pyrophosphatase MutT (NUDIX family)